MRTTDSASSTARHRRGKHALHDGSVVTVVRHSPYVHPDVIHPPNCGRRPQPSLPRYRDLPTRGSRDCARCPAASSYRTRRRQLGSGFVGLVPAVFASAAVAADVSPPSQPLNVSTSVSGSTATLTWDASSDDVGVASYEIHTSMTPGFIPEPATLLDAHSRRRTTTTMCPRGRGTTGSSPKTPPATPAFPLSRCPRRSRSRTTQRLHLSRQVSRRVASGPQLPVVDSVDRRRGRCRLRRPRLDRAGTYALGRKSAGFHRGPWLRRD